MTVQELYLKLASLPADAEVFYSEQISKNGWLLRPVGGVGVHNKNQVHIYMEKK